MRWVSKSKSIREMKEKHEERRLRIAAEVADLFKDEEPTATFSLIPQYAPPNYLGQLQLGVQQAQSQAMAMNQQQMVQNQLQANAVANTQQAAQLQAGINSNNYLLGQSLSGFRASVLGGLF